MDEGGEGRTVYGYAAVFDSETNLGWFSEVIEKGAFDEALGRSDCRALFNHKDEYLLARQSSGTLKLSIDEVGLRYEFTAPNTSIGNDLLEMMERGDLNQSSFAFTIEKESWEYDDSGEEMKRTRRIQKIDMLYDVSPVTYPAYADTTVAKRNFDSMIKEGKEEVGNMINKLQNGTGRALLDEIEEATDGVPVEIVKAIYY